MKLAKKIMLTAIGGFAIIAAVIVFVSVFSAIGGLAHVGDIEPEYRGRAVAGYLGTMLACLIMAGALGFFGTLALIGGIKALLGKEAPYGKKVGFLLGGYFAATVTATLFSMIFWGVWGSWELWLELSFQSAGLALVLIAFFSKLSVKVKSILLMAATGVGAFLCIFDWALGGNSAFTVFIFLMVSTMGALYVINTLLGDGSDPFEGKLIDKAS